MAHCGDWEVLSRLPGELLCVSTPGKANQTPNAVSGLWSWKPFAQGYRSPSAVHPKRLYSSVLSLPFLGAAFSPRWSPIDPRWPNTPPTAGVVFHSCLHDPSELRKILSDRNPHYASLLLPTFPFGFLLSPSPFAASIPSRASALPVVGVCKLFHSPGHQLIQGERQPVLLPA
eukprot:GGOE01029875.1.p2 GENE.GGOE01029875.1~~GGOE01029875.1.p2  ORF type:complete len:173 (-),score=5.11 GGOE01029875.1:431-949(-)